VQVTELVDGILIGCSENHAVADATTFQHFFNTWSEISRGNCDNLQPHPIIERNFFDGIINFPIQVPSPLKVKAERFIPKPLQRRYFHFTKEKIAELKAEANNIEMGTDRISSLQAVVGFLAIHASQSVSRF